MVILCEEFATEMVWATPEPEAWIEKGIVWERGEVVVNVRWVANLEGWVSLVRVRRVVMFICELERIAFVTVSRRPGLLRRSLSCLIYVMEILSRIWSCDGVT